MKLKKLKRAALKNVNLLENDYDRLNKSLSYDLNIGITNFSEEENRYFNCQRKERKYASFTIELNAIVEQLLKDIYQKYYEEEFDGNGHVIETLEKKLGNFIEFGKSVNNKNLVALRNYIVHQKYSLELAKKNAEKFDLDRNMSNEELFSLLFKNTYSYIEKIKKIKE
ncbi:hypothetical protein [Sporolactobacillus nakayamae]|uniref:Uncharacterized protein n=1 Tax=Sporolactobacillus nakayamae TaxID=269670 RepID=A0A1I2P474_9BACL|nr:hypothetical protein [Sporolactobacillus nakayamae]SFG10884.1 hypothetical protein SAMN02982927_00705 [Sporolactobacillus nakayamae]